jgi:hypothetical protein
MPCVNGICAVLAAIDHGRERIDGRSERADAGPDHDDRDRGDRIVARRQDHRDDERIERERLLGHAVGRASEREQRHQDRDHPDLVALERRRDPADARVDGAGLGHDTEKSADDEHEQRDVDGAGLLGRGVVHARDRRHDDVAQALRIGRDAVVGARHRHFLAELLVHDAVVLPRGHDPGERRDEQQQSEQDRVGGREPALRFSGFGRIRGRAG